MIEIKDIKYNHLHCLSTTDFNFSENNNSSVYSNDLNNLSYNENDFTFISENIRFLKQKRFRDKNSEKSADAKSYFNEKYLFDVLNSELNNI